MENKLLFCRESATDAMALPAREIIAITVDASTELKIWFDGLDASDRGGELELITSNANAKTAIKAIVYEINFSKKPMSTVADDVDGIYLDGITGVTTITH